MKKLFPLILPIMFIYACSMFSVDIAFESKSLKFAINDKGEVVQIADKDNGVNYLSEDSLSVIMSVRVNNNILVPESAKFEKEKKLLLLTYAGNLKAEIKVNEKDPYISFELLSVSDMENVELIIWGPYPTIINKIIGETVGVVRGESYALGIQALNPKTLGGYPWLENDCMPQIDIFDQKDLSDMKEEGKRYVLYRVEAAKPADFGSTLQAYTRNRNKERIIENWGHERYTALVLKDGGVVGSKIALFGCPVDKALETIGEIEVAEGLPHPMIDGEWGKTARSASAAYLIMGFGEKDIQRSIDITKKAGLRYLYHPGPFKNWGHFDLHGQFPNGWAGMKKCVETAEKQGIMLGVHTLSNFITPNDPYVSPIPDKRLARVGTSILTGDISKSQTEIPLESPDFFNQFKNNHLKTVVVENELIRYGEVSERAPWKLLDCQRGAFGTEKANHKKGEVIGKLADHAYKVFLTDPELTVEMSKNIAELYNETGLRQISFDGLEGCRSTALGNYGEILFAQTWYDNLDKKIKDHYIADASRTSHYFWHMYTRMNWGEPWYAGFRESQTEYRMKNQPYFKRNFMPAMLGWFKMTSETSVEDIEWMLTRSAAFNAGYAFVTGYQAVDENGQSDHILHLLGEWEKARMADVFSMEQKELMKDLDNEFRLKTVAENEWNLFRIYSYKFKHEKKVRQPGEPLYSKFNFKNEVDKQPLSFILTAADGNAKDIVMEIDNYKKIKLPVTLKQGQTLKYEGGEFAVIYNKNWKKIRQIQLKTSDLAVGKGDHTMTFDCGFYGGKEPHIKLEVRITGPAEHLKVKK